MYYSVSDFYKNLFGEKVYKLSIDGGCTCPNRDGTKGWLGCIFCSEGGSGEFAAGREDTIQKQLEKAKSLVASKIKTGKYIAYFQNFTNTYGDFDRITSNFLEAAETPGIVGLAIATRPDCLTDKMLDFLSALSERIFIQIEFGLQTSNEKTAEFIRRCYPLEIYDDAVLRVKKIAPKIHIVTHIIFGLPGETERDMMNTVRHAVEQKTDGIKIAVLHVLKNTDLAEIFEKEPFHILSMEEYFDLVKKALEIIPRETVIHRLTGDGAKRLLIEPKWTADKHRVWNGLMKVLNQ